MRRHLRQILLGLTSLLPAGVLQAQGVPAVNVGWYNGDPQMGIPGAANWYVSDQQFSRIYDNFTVPAGGWTLAGLFSINSMSVTGVTEAVWEIRSGVSAGNGGTATQQLTETWPDGSNIYRIQTNIPGTVLAPGTYWVNVSPVIAQWSSTAAGALSCVAATVWANAAGTPA
jgi:hypothetical protein